MILFETSGRPLAVPTGLLSQLKLAFTRTYTRHYLYETAFHEHDLIPWILPMAIELALRGRPALAENLPELVARLETRNSAGSSLNELWSEILALSQTRGA